MRISNNNIIRPFLCFLSASDFFARLSDTLFTYQIISDSVNLVYHKNAISGQKIAFFTFVKNPDSIGSREAEQRHKTARGTISSAGL